MEAKPATLRMYPRVKLLSFFWEEQSFYRLGNDFRVEGESRQDIVRYSVWESETFGDRWEVVASYLNRYTGEPLLYLLKWIPLDRPRPLRIGETFRAVRKTPMTAWEKQRRQRHLQQGKLMYKSHVSVQEYKKALGELVRECFAIPINKRNLTPKQKLTRFQCSMAKQEAGEADPRGSLWPHIAKCSDPMLNTGTD